MRELVPLCVPALLLAYRRLARRGPAGRAVLATLAALLVAACGHHAFEQARENVRTPHEWDFLDFWIGARAAAHGDSFYDPDAYRRWGEGLGVSDEFEREVLDVGFKHPPYLMLLFAPLGHLPLSTALLVWYLVNGAVVLAVVILLYRLFLSAAGWSGLAVAAALLLMHSASWSTVSLAQTNFLLLLAILLAWRALRERAGGGGWLGAAAVIKPLGVGLLLGPLLRRETRTLRDALALVTGLSLIALFAFGPGTTWNFLSDGPAAKLPRLLFTQTINQSLLAVVLRSDPACSATIALAIWSALGASLLGVSAWLLTRIPSSRELALGLCLALALLLAPHSLAHYSLLLLPALLWIWTSARSGAALTGALLLITAEYALAEWDRADAVFAGNALAWLVLAWLAWREARDRQPPTLPLRARGTPRVA